jgi:hypothetical protein
MRFPVLVTILLAAIFVVGGIAGAFVYATGQQVILTPVMNMVSHTEYRFSEPGQIIARLVDYQGDPVVVTNCYATILNPDKTYFVNHSLMQNVSLISGDHYFNFTTPTGPEGTYEYQAVCNYGPGGSKSASVTNSFHLSSAFTSIMANQTAQSLQLTAIQGNVTQVQNSLTQLSAEVSNVNVTLGGQITSLSSQLNANVTTILNDMQSGNTNTLNAIAGNASMIESQLTNVNSTLFQAIQNVSANLTPILDAITALNVSTQETFGLVQSQISAFEGAVSTNFSVVTGNQVTILANQATAYTALQEINSTSNSIYTYMTTTLAGNVNDVLAGMGVINETVNRIETVSNTINATTATILENQQNQVVMSVTSG